MKEFPYFPHCSFEFIGISRQNLHHPTDLAPLVGADLEVMDRDSKKMREEKPYLFADLKTYKGLDDIVEWLTKEFLF